MCAAVTSIADLVTLEAGRPDQVQRGAGRALLWVRLVTSPCSWGLSGASIRTPISFMGLHMQALIPSQRPLLQHHHMQGQGFHT